MLSTPIILPYVTKPSCSIRTLPETILENRSSPTVSEIKTKSSFSITKNVLESDEIFISGSKDLEKFKLYCSSPEKQKEL